MVKFSAQPDTIISSLNIQDPMLIYVLHNKAVTDAIQQVSPFFWRESLSKNESQLRNEMSKIIRDKLLPIWEQEILKFDDRFFLRDWPQILQQHPEWQQKSKEEVLPWLKEERSDALRKWVHELSETNDPLFIAVGLNALKKFRRSRVIPTVNAEIVGMTRRALAHGDGNQNDQTVGFLDLYNKQTLQESGVSDHGWKVFPQGSDPEILSSICQGTGWCLGTDINAAKRYLKEQDIHLYFDDKPKIAMGVKDNHVTQVYEPYNKNLNKYLEVAMEYISKHNYKIDDSTSGGEDLIDAINLRKLFYQDPRQAAEDLKKHFHSVLPSITPEMMKNKDFAMEFNRLFEDSLHINSIEMIVKRLPYFLLIAQLLQNKKNLLTVPNLPRLLNDINGIPELPLSQKVLSDYFSSEEKQPVQANWMKRLFK